MDTKMIDKNWTELKSKIQSKWAKFSDAEVESVKADLSLLSGKIQATYSVTKDKAEKEFDEFKTSVQSLLTAESVAAPQVIKTATAPSSPEDGKVN